MDEDRDELEEGRELDESITDELREYAAEHSYWRRGTEYVTLNDLLSIADRIDARFDRELQSKQGEVDGLKADVDDLQARLDASILPPVDIDGARWTGEDVDWLFSYEGDESNEHVVREIAYAWPRDGWFIVDQYDTHYPADKCRHVKPEPPDSQERIDADARKVSCDYFGRSTGWCHGCPAENGGDCATIKALDLLRRQRELDGAGEHA